MKKKEKDILSTVPLFTGDYRRDTAVSETEKVSEASNAFFNVIKAKWAHRKKNNKKG